MVYYDSFATAVSRGETLEFTRSNAHLTHCAMRIRDAIAISYDLNKHTLDTDSVIRAAKERYTNEQISVVLANTVLKRLHDGRITAENKEWAKTVRLPKLTDMNYIDAHADSSHIGLMDMVVTEWRKHLKEVEAKSIFTHDIAASIVELFEDALGSVDRKKLLALNGIKLPTSDGDEQLQKSLDVADIMLPSPEDGDRDEDNCACLYGSVYSDLLDGVEATLIEILEAAKDPEAEIVTGMFSGR